MMNFKYLNKKGGGIKRFIITTPEGNKIYTDRGLAHFCRENNLNYSNMYNIVNGLVDNYKGWLCEKIS